MSRKNNHGIVKHLGQVNTARNLKGRLVERQDFLFIKFGEDIIYAPAVYDDIHFLYQNALPVTEADVISKYGGVLPLSQQGANVMCTCGIEGVLMLEGPYKGMMLCKAVAQLGKHQTSFEQKDGRLILDRQTEDRVMMSDTDLNKSIRTEEQAADEHLDAITHHTNDDVGES